MHRRSVPSVVAILIATVVSATASDLGAILTAMACCAKTNYACAGLSAPDDCCQRMQQAAPRSTASTIPTAPAAGAPATLSKPSALAMRAPAEPVLAPLSFVRPHDPPHLHTFALLI